MAEGRNAGEGEVGEPGELLEKKVNCRNSDLLAIRKVDALEGVMALFAETNDCLIGQVDDLKVEGIELTYVRKGQWRTHPDKADATKFL